MKILFLVVATWISTCGFAQVIDDSKFVEFARQIELKPTNPENPVSMNAAFFSKTIHANEEAYLLVKINVHKNWHIYAYVPEGGFFIQSEIKMDLPNGVEANLVKEPKVLAYEADPEIMLYKGELLFVYKLTSNEVPAGSYNVKTTLYYQPCDPYACLPPNETEVENQLIIKSK
ncbi:MAG: protein-disulfide reductase DsbD family protein [Marinifilum sp.]|jgi:DsbC/DsbD-like thiol-disulfide interchange protein|nr:protein-disulfide reductase DsbD family protein [Marinifilum sp.]